MSIKQMDNKLFEALFRQAIIDDYNDEIEGIPPRKELMKKISFSPEFELRMIKLFARDRRRNILVNSIYFGKRVAVVFVLAVTILSLVLLTNPEVRAAIKNTIVEWYDKYTSIIFRGQEVSDTVTIKEFKFQNIPSGYSESLVGKFGKTTDMEYENDMGDIIYISYWPESNSTNISVDNENHIINSMHINGHEAFIAEATNEDFDNGIVWSMEGYRFTIWSKLPIDELIKIVESIDW